MTSGFGAFSSAKSTVAKCARADRGHLGLHEIAAGEARHDLVADGDPGPPLERHDVALVGHHGGAHEARQQHLVAGHGHHDAEARAVLGVLHGGDGAGAQRAVELQVAAGLEPEEVLAAIRSALDEVGLGRGAAGAAGRDHRQLERVAEARAEDDVARRDLLVARQRQDVGVGDDLGRAAVERQLRGRLADLDHLRLRVARAVVGRIGLGLVERGARRGEHPLPDSRGEPHVGELGDARGVVPGIGRRGVRRRPFGDHRADDHGECAPEVHGLAP
ncbi:MAG: hypothetical protein U1F43_20030 [Myxococcota bacterium]